jgi:tetratricopeptide (TPR) repeat protein
MLPGFSVMDSSGKGFQRVGREGRALLVAFLSAGQTRSVRAGEDLKNMLATLGPSAEDLDVLVVLDDPNDPFAQSEQWKGADAGVRIIVDSDLTLWGKFGLIVMPSLLICDMDNRVVWIESGYNYSSGPIVNARLKQAMGMEQKVSPDEAGKVKTVVNSTFEARISRHVQMAKVLMGKGLFDMAVSELGKAQKLDPNSIELRLELGELYCRGNKPVEAIRLLSGTEGTTRKMKARVNVVLGWAHRKKDDLKSAERLLLNAITLDTRSVRGLFELGRVYQAQEKLEDAVATYRRALELVLNDPVHNGVSQK